MSPRARRGAGDAVAGPEKNAHALRNDVSRVTRKCVKPCRASLPTPVLVPRARARTPGRSNARLAPPGRDANHRTPRAATTGHARAGGFRPPRCRGKRSSVLPTFTFIGAPHVLAASDWPFVARAHSLSSLAVSHHPCLALPPLLPSGGPTGPGPVRFSFRFSLGNIFRYSLGPGCSRGTVFGPRCSWHTAPRDSGADFSAAHTAAAAAAARSGRHFPCCCCGEGEAREWGRAIRRSCPHIL